MRTFPKLSALEIRHKLERLRGQAAAVVYSFEPEKTPQKIWYDQWRSDVISFYGASLEAVGVRPYFIDVTTFCRQALAKELPTLICAFNLNAGITPITHWAVMPSVSLWAGVEPMPVRADVLIMGERKDTAALVAREAGLQIPKTFLESELGTLAHDTMLVTKPRDLGGSVGIRVVRKFEYEPPADHTREPYLIQEFIPGYDLTVPVIYRPSTGNHIAPVGTLYLPTEHSNTMWIHDENSKRTNKGYAKTTVAIPERLQIQLVAAADRMELGPYARFDLRVRLSSYESIETISLADVWFLEVNPLPTLRRNVNLIDAVSSPAFRSAIHGELEAMTQVCPGPSNQIVEAFPIACSLLSLPV